MNGTSMKESNKYLIITFNTINDMSQFYIIEEIILD